MLLVALTSNGVEVEEGESYACCKEVFGGTSNFFQFFKHSTMQQELSLQFSGDISASNYRDIFHSEINVPTLLVY